MVMVVYIAIDGETVGRVGDLGYGASSIDHGAYVATVPSETLSSSLYRASKYWME